MDDFYTIRISGSVKGFLPSVDDDGALTMIFTDRAALDALAIEVKFALRDWVKADA
jgi:hypothetical protein